MRIDSENPAAKLTAWKRVIPQLDHNLSVAADEERHNIWKIVRLGAPARAETQKRGYFSFSGKPSFLNLSMSWRASSIAVSSRRAA